MTFGGRWWIRGDFLDAFTSVTETCRNIQNFRHVVMELTIKLCTC